MVRVHIHVCVCVHANIHCGKFSPTSQLPQESTAKNVCTKKQQLATAYEKGNRKMGNILCGWMGQWVVVVSSLLNLRMSFSQPASSGKRQLEPNREMYHMAYGVGRSVGQLFGQPLDSE